MDSPNPDGGCDSKLGSCRASLLGCGGQLAGDTKARLALELPIYNFLVYLGVWAGIPVNVAGRLISALLWALGFLLLQEIWRRWLDIRETFWANLLFVLSPASIAFGQAIMPEMLVQLLGVGFILLLFRYDRNPSLIGWWSLVTVGALGALIKLPGFTQYYLILGVMLFFATVGKSLRKRGSGLEEFSPSPFFGCGAATPCP